MSILFTCPHCGKQTTVADEFAGRSVPCAGCGKTITITPPGNAVFPVPPQRFSVLRVVVVLAFILGLLGYLLLPTVNSHQAPRRNVRE